MKSKTEVRIKAVPDATMELPYPRLYANLALVQSTPFDFTIRFCDALPMYDIPEAPDGEIIENKIPIVAEIVLPVGVFPNLIEAMTKHFNQYMQVYGEPKKDEKKKRNPKISA